MSRIKINKELFNKCSDNPITWKDIKDFQFEDDDIITIGWEEPYYSENNSYDGHYYCYINRYVEETEEEYSQRIENNKIFLEELRKKRYESYLKLKKEFENE